MDSKVDGITLHAWWAWFSRCAFSVRVQEMGRRQAIGFDEMRQLPSSQDGKVGDAPAES